jgi:hypothetical protein
MIEIEYTGGLSQPFCSVCCTELDNSTMLESLRLPSCSAPFFRHL